MPCVGIRNRDLSGGVAKAGPGEFLSVAYEHTVLGFRTGYWEYTDLAELETVIKAHLGLYALMASAVEEALRAGLAEAE